MKKNYLNYARYVNFAFSFGTTSVVSMLLGFFGGQWLDKKFGTTPIFILVGVFLGIGLTFKSLVTELKILNKIEENLEKEKENAGKNKKKG